MIIRYPSHGEIVRDYPNKVRKYSDDVLLEEIDGRTPARAGRNDYRAWRRTLITEAVRRGLIKDPMDAPKTGREEDW